MKKALVAPMALSCVLGFASNASALLPVFRCSFDQLPSPSPGQTYAQDRRMWAQFNANGNPYKTTAYGGKDPRFWDPTYTNDTNLYAAQGVQLYPGYVDPTRKFAAWKPSIYLTLTTSYTVKPEYITMDGVCEAGCYTPDQAVLFGGGAVPIQEAQQAGRRDLITLTPDATFDSISFLQNSVASFTFDKVDASQDILIFRTESGGELKVTLEHPLLTQDGAIHPARQVFEGDSLLREDGSPDKITSVRRAKWFGRAYNLRPKTTDFLSNIVVAQGYLNGSARFQNEYVEDMNRIILRKNVPDEAIPTKRARH